RARRVPHHVPAKSRAHVASVGLLVDYNRASGGYRVGLLDCDSDLQSVHGDGIGKACERRCRLHGSHRRFRDRSRVVLSVSAAHKHLLSLKLRELIMTAEILEHSGLIVEETPLDAMALPALDTFEYKYPGNEIKISFTCPEFTAICP